MKSYDPNVPPLLKKTQQWFGSIISRPIDEDSRMNPISPSGLPMEEEAFEHIAPSPTLRPAQRIQIYNQQYWWRLLNCLHESFPLVVRLFGYHDFNQTIAIPYLCKYPPDTWAINALGANLSKWIEEEYQAEDKILVGNSVAVDWAFNEAFICNKFEPATDVAVVSEKTVYLQPYVTLFAMDYDLFAFREIMIKQKPEHWVDNPFPELLKGEKRFFALWRNQHNDISWDEIPEGAYALLGQMNKGSTIDALCEWLENAPDKMRSEAETHLPSWFQQWTLRQLLTVESR